MLPSIEEDQLSFFTVCVMMVVDVLLYMVLTWYIEGVYPGRYGVAKPWYFPFMPSYWCGQNTCGISLRKRGGTHHVTLNEEGDESEMIGRLELTCKHTHTHARMHVKLYTYLHVPTCMTLYMQMLTISIRAHTHTHSGLAGDPDSGPADVEGSGEAVCEDEPSHLPLGISVKQLTKTYKLGWIPTKRKVVQSR